MDRTGWLERYRRAWEERDAAAAGELFTEDAVYRDQVFEPAHEGRDAIRRYWEGVTIGQRDIQLRYGTPLSVQDRLAVEWWVNLQHEGNDITIAGEFMLRFAASGQCRELREYWVLTKGRHDPPEGWGR